MVITPTSDSMLSSTDAMFLCHHLDDELSQEWKCLYSSQYHGESFTRMSTSITNQGPLVIVVADECGHVFGGHVSTNMKFQSDFQGLTPVLCSALVLVLETVIYSIRGNFKTQTRLELYIQILSMFGIKVDL